jgi:hypothetical protein
VLRRVPPAGEDNLFGVALAAPNNMESLEVSTRHDGQRIARQAFRVELRLNLRLQLVARCEGAHIPADLVVRRLRHISIAT